MAGTTLVYPYEPVGGKRAVASEVMGNFYAIQTTMVGINAEINDLLAIKWGNRKVKKHLLIN